MVIMHSIDYKINEYCAKKIYESLESEELISSETLENFIKSLAILNKNNEAIGPECVKLYYEINAIHSYPTGIESKSDEEQFSFYLGAIYGIIHMAQLGVRHE